MLATAIASETNGRLPETVYSVKQKLTTLVNTSSIGQRLMEAFGTNDKNIIAEKLGFSSVQAVYKIVRGERELDFEKLQKFRDYTNCSIDWLLTGEGPMTLHGGPREFDLERSIERHGDEWLDVMEDWYKFEGSEMPEFEGASLMGGWGRLDHAEKVAAIRDLKGILDRTRDKG